MKVKYTRNPNYVENKFILMLIVFVFCCGLKLHTSRKHFLLGPSEFELEELKFPLKPLLFTISNGGFMDFTFNWMLNWQKHDVNDTLIICTDHACVDELQSEKEKENGHRYRNRIQLFNLNIDKGNKNDGNFFVYNDAKYGKLVNMRPTILLGLYKEYYTKFMNSNFTTYNALLYMDADMGIVQNFIPSLQRLQYTNFDITMVSDGVGSPDYMCSCIILIPFKANNYDRMVYFLSQWHKMSQGLGKPRNQFALRAVLRRGIVALGSLNLEQYPNGQLMQNSTWRQLHFESANTKINTIHANYMSGFENKRQFLVDNGYWFLKKK